MMRIVTAVRHLRTPSLFIGNNALQVERLALAEAGGIGRGRFAAICIAPLS